MGKYYGAGGRRIGKVGEELYEIRNGTNIVRVKNSYIPVNNAWIKREEFKEYVLSLLEEGIPQIYVLEELPEDLYPYALLFVKNGDTRDIYVDKNLTRTKINVGSGEGNYDAVNVVENLPQNLEDNVIYYSENKINEQKTLKKGFKLEEQKSYIYVQEDEEIKQVIPNVDYIAEEEMVFKNKTISGEDNTVANLIPEESIKQGYILDKIEEGKQYYGYISVEEPKEIVFLDKDGEFVSSYVYKATLENNIITEIISKSDSLVTSSGMGFYYDEKHYERYNVVDQVFPLLDKTIAYSGAIKTYVNEKIQPLNDLTTKSLKDIYNTTLTADNLVCTNNSGYLMASDISRTNTKLVVNNVLNKSLKNIYNQTLTTDKLVYSDSNGCLAASDISKTDAKKVVDGVTTKSLKTVYNATLTANKVLISDSNGSVSASAISSTDAKTVIEGVSTKALRTIYNTTLTANKLLCSASNGSVTTQDKYSVDSTLSMSGTTIGMPNKLSSALAKNLYQCSFDIQGRCTSATAIAVPHLYIYHYLYDRDGIGEVNFNIYTSKSTALTSDELGDYMTALGCTGYWRPYPATGQSQTGKIITGIYAQLNSSQFVKYTFYVVINASEYEDIYPYTNTVLNYKLQIF